MILFVMKTRPTHNPAFTPKSPKSTVFKQRYFGLPLLNFAPTSVVRKLVSSKIFRLACFGNTFNQLLFGTKQLGILPFDLF